LICIIFFFEKLLNKHAEKLAKELDEDVGMLGRDIHVVGDFHGNRSPLADPLMRGSIEGLQLSNTIEDFIRLYVSTIQSIGHSIKRIVDVMNCVGHRIESVLISGSVAKNRLFLKQLADILNKPVILANEQQAMLVGCAIIAAVAAGKYNSIEQAMIDMSHIGSVIEPTIDDRLRRFHETKHLIMLRMTQLQQENRKMIQESIK
jgi:ribulose kinase